MNLKIIGLCVFGLALSMQIYSYTSQKRNQQIILETNESISNQIGPQNHTFTVNGVNFNMVYVEGGAFFMGAQNTDPDSPNYDSDCICANETPMHSVTVNDYYIGETEVTQALWKAVMDGKSHGNKDNKPMDNLSKSMVDDFISKLNQITGLNFRIPSEEEWEYAARGGQKSKGYLYSGSSEINDVAWYTNNSGYKTHRVGEKKPNELGLFDMSGNVEELCVSKYGQNYNYVDGNTYIVLRGGSCSQIEIPCKVTSRVPFLLHDHKRFTGLRLALTLPSDELK